MEELEKVNQEVEEVKTEEAVAEEKKPEAKEIRKAKKAEKPSLAKRAQSAVVRNKKPLIAGFVGFVTGAASAIGGSMWLGHKHRKAEAMALRETPVLPEENYSPLDPNVME